MPIYRAVEPDGTMYRNYEQAASARQGGQRMELSIYEINHHPTFGDAPPEPRNRVVTSIGGGLALANAMLLELRDHKIRTQCMFNLIQLGYRAHGIGPVRIWGGALNMRQGRERYRPTFLVCSLANQVIAGDLVETRHSGAEPKVAAKGLWKRKQQEFSTYSYPAIFSYAFRKESRKGLILLNLHTSEAQSVEIRFPDGDKERTVQSWLLTGEKFTDTNEFEERTRKVATRESKIPAFRSGHRLTLPPFSMVGLVWE